MPSAFLWDRLFHLWRFRQWVGNAFYGPDPWTVRSHLLYLLVLDTCCSFPQGGELAQPRIFISSALSIRPPSSRFREIYSFLINESMNHILSVPIESSPPKAIPTPHTLMGSREICTIEYTDGGNAEWCASRQRSHLLILLLKSGFSDTEFEFIILI